MDKFNYISSHSRVDGFVMGAPYPIYSNCGGGEFSNFSAGAVATCNLRYPPPRTKSAKKKAYQDCLVSEQKKIDAKKASGGGGILGIGTGRRKACKEAGLTGAEKRQCARELKARGWKKGQSIPADMAGITAEDVAEVADEQSEEELVDSTSNGDSDDSGSVGAKKVDAKKILLYGGIAIGAIAGISLLAWGIGSAFTASAAR